MLFGAGEENKNNLKKKNSKKNVKSVQIHMKNPESDEQKEKENFIFFRFLFFEVWSFQCPFSEKIAPISDDNSEK